MTPSITVLMCAYNATDTVNEAIDSVLSQTLQNFELLLVNDGSTDDTLAILESYVTDSRVSIISKENSGLGDSRNQALKNIKTTWVAFIDADDVWHKEKLQLQFNALNEFPAADVIVTNMVHYDKFSNADISLPKNTLYENFFEELALHNFPFQPVTSMLKTSLFNDIANFAKDKSGQDFYPFLKFAFHNKKFVKVNAQLYGERSLEGSLQRSPNSMFLGATARVNAINKILSEEPCNESQKAILLKAKDNYLGWAISGVRRTRSYFASINYCVTVYPDFTSTKKYLTECGKCILFPINSMFKK